MKAASIEWKNSTAYSTNRVVGTIRDADGTDAIDALLRAGFAREDIDILHNEEDLQRLDPTGAAHGFLAQFHRTLIHGSTSRSSSTSRIRRARACRSVRAGWCWRRSEASASPPPRTGPVRRRLRRVLRPMVVRGRARHRSDVARRHSGPVRTGMERGDPAALTVLFDEDAEFVSVDGQALHDRAALRKWHAARLERELQTSTVVTSETKVKLLSTEFAVVHARLTLSDPERPTAAARPGPR